MSKISVSSKESVGNVYYPRESTIPENMFSGHYFENVMESLQKAQNSSAEVVLFEVGDGTFYYWNKLMGVCSYANKEDLLAFNISPNFIRLHFNNAGSMIFQEIDLIEKHPEILPILILDSEQKVKDFVSFLINDLNINWHPDSSFADYLVKQKIVDSKGTIIDFSKVSIEFIDAKVEVCFNIVGDELYTIGMEILQEKLKKQGVAIGEQIRVDEPKPEKIVHNLYPQQISQAQYSHFSDETFDRVYDSISHLSLRPTITKGDENYDNITQIVEMEYRSENKIDFSDDLTLAQGNEIDSIITNLISIKLSNQRNQPFFPDKDVINLIFDLKDTTASLINYLAETSNEEKKRIYGYFEEDLGPEFSKILLTGRLNKWFEFLTKEETERARSSSFNNTYNYDLNSTLNNFGNLLVKLYEYAVGFDMSHTNEESDLFNAWCFGDYYPFQESFGDISQYIRSCIVSMLNPGLDDNYDEFDDTDYRDYAHKILTEHFGPKNKYSGSADWGGIPVWTIKGDKFTGTFIGIDDNNDIFLMNRTFDEVTEENIDEELDTADPKNTAKVMELINKALQLKTT